MKTSVLNRSVPRLGALTDRQLNRLILGVAIALIIGIPTLAILYVIDQAASRQPTLAERQISTLEAQVRENPNTISLRLQLAGAYGAAKRYDDGIAQLTAVLQASPDEKTALVTRGDYYLIEQKLDLAAADYEHVISITAGGEFANVDTELHQAYYNLGSIRLGQGNAADAIKNLEAALVINKTDADTLNLLGQAYLASGDAATAVERLRAAILFVPVGWADPYTTLQKAYTALGKTDEATWAGAMADYAGGNVQAALGVLGTLTSGDAAVDAYVGIGLANEQLGDTAAALAAYRSALALDPQNFTALDGQTRTSAPAASPTGAGGG
jgi:tetratricopeptide (TPR) repeat protein